MINKLSLMHGELEGIEMVNIIITNFSSKGRWDWVRAPYKADREMPVGRYQHSSMFISSMLFIIGGRTNTVGETLTIDVYDTETSEWSKFNSI